MFYFITQSATPCLLIYLLCHVQLFVTPWTAVAPCPYYLLEFAQTHVLPTISFSVTPFSSCLQSFSASGSFPMSQLFASGGQSIRVLNNMFSSVQSLSHVRLFATIGGTMNRSTPGLPVHHQLRELTQTQVHPVASPPAFNLSQHQGLFQRVHSLHQVYWSFSYSISPSNDYLGLISFRMDWLDLLAVQGTLKTLLQHHSSKASILPCSAFFIVQLSHPYMTTGKTIALTRQTFVG